MSLYEELIEELNSANDKKVQYLLALKLIEAGIVADIIYEEPFLVQKMSEDGAHVSYTANTRIKDLELDFSGYHNRLWVPCDERMPETSGWYIITVGRARRVYADYYDKRHNEWQDYCGSDVLAWQPLPKPYMPMED